MQILKRLFSPAGMVSQRQVAERVVHVVEQVIFDMGADRLVQGTFQLDRRCRPRFIGSVTHVPERAQASVTLARLAESAAMRAASAGQGDDLHVLRAHTAALVDGLLREFHAQSARFRALPATADA